MRMPVIFSDKQKVFIELIHLTIMTTTITTNLIPEKEPNQHRKKGYIHDILIGIQTDRCTLEACPRIRLLVRFDDFRFPSRVYMIDFDSLRALKRVYGSHLSRWLNKELMICSRLRPGGKVRVKLVPIEQ